MRSSAWMGDEFRAIQKRSGAVTSLYVTRATRLEDGPSDQACNHGQRRQQGGGHRDIYHYPANRTVAAWNAKPGFFMLRSNARRLPVPDARYSRSRVPAGAASSSGRRVWPGQGVVVVVQPEDADSSARPNPWLPISSAGPVS